MKQEVSILFSPEKNEYSHIIKKAQTLYDGQSHTHLNTLNYPFLEKTLLFALENGMINIDDVQNQMNKKRKEELLKQHPYDIWQGKDSRYRTYVTDKTRRSGRRMIVKTHQETLLDYLTEYYDKLDESKQMETITLEKLYPQWQEYKKLHTTAENYIRRIDNDWKKYYANTDIAKIPVLLLNKLTLDKWAHQLIKDYGMTKKQYYNCTIIMRQTLDYAVDLKIIENNPFSAITIDGKRLFKQVRKKPDSTQVFLKEELTSIYNMAWEDFYTVNRLANKLAPLAVLFQFQTGVRIGELCVLRYEDIDKSGYIHIQRMYRYETHEVVEHTKNHEDRHVLLTAAAKKIICTAKEHQQENGCNINRYIFSESKEPLSPWSVEYLYNKYCEQSGIVRKSSHKSRKTYISALIDGQVNINTIREMVGHVDERTTFNNYCFDRCNDSEKAQLIENALCN